MNPLWRSVFISVFGSLFMGSASEVEVVDDYKIWSVVVLWEVMEYRRLLNDILTCKLKFQ